MGLPVSELRCAAEAGLVVTLGCSAIASRADGDALEVWEGERCRKMCMMDEELHSGWRWGPEVRVTPSLFRTNEILQEVGEKKGSRGERH